MKAARDIGPLMGHLAMTTAIVVIIVAGAIVHAQLTPAGVPAEPPGAAAGMPPGIRFPVLALLSAVVALAAALINFFLQALDHRRLRTVQHWMLLGAAFCLMLLGFPLVDAGFTPSSGFAFSIAAAMLAALAVRWRYGETEPGM